MKLNIVKLWLSNSQLIKKRKPPGGEGQVCRVLTCLGIAQRLSCLQPLSLTWMCLQWDFIRYIVQSFSLNVFSIIHATVLLNSACNYISHLSQTILLKFILSVRRLHSTLSLGAPDVYILYLLVLFWPSILCSQWVKVNANDLSVHLFFFSWLLSVCPNIVFIVCRSCVCWASGCCWDKHSQRDGKNKRRTALVSQTFMWKIRRRKVSRGLLFYSDCSKNTA